ncbi:3-phytase B [Exophiala viscosa]|uniref:3-phytase n=1 Tax=Exophiala viscosa TaxID=2486360 RepID=A0AAN6DSP8_9EURO|nr:3-phytase B [Exophiala viscosa]
MSLFSLILTGLAATSAYAQSRPYNGYQEKQFSQNFYDSYNPIKHMGGIGPYSDRVGYGIDPNPPAGCAVDQVIMLMRHGERYPDATTAAKNQAALNKVYATNITKWAGDLAFLNDWTFYITNQGLLEQETFSGPYSGLLNAFKRGSEYGNKYGHLWDGQTTVPIFAGGYERVVETARYFGKGFFGYNYSTSAAINIISENYTQGADSLTPTCLADTGLVACFYTTRTLPQFEVAAQRLNSQNPGLNLNSTDILALMAVGTFELQSRSYSPWINAFTLDEWVAFGYIQDLSYYYCSGPGDPYQIAVGQVFANASLALMEAGPSHLPMSWNFAHDAYITPIVAALGLDVPSSPLPNNSVPFPNPYNSADIVPMGGHLVLERLSCNATASSAAGKYVRAVINEAVVPWPTCQSGPGFSCPFANFTTIVNNIPNFVSTCGVAKAGYPEYLDFWWNYNTTQTLNYQNGSIGYRETYTLV